MTSVVVSGTARRWVAPDRAILALGLSVVAGDAASALDAVAASSAELAAVLDRSGVPAGDRSTGGVTVAEEWEWRADTNVLVGHRASTGLSLVLDDVALIAPVLRVAVGARGAHVRGITWEVHREHPARLDLLGEAARDARRRASAYVDALGLRLGPVELISESPIGAEPPTPRTEAAPMLAMSAAERADAPELRVQPGRVELTATVHVRFTVLA